LLHDNNSLPEFEALNFALSASHMSTLPVVMDKYVKNV
jgi:hypothetical protein